MRLEERNTGDAIQKRWPVWRIELLKLIRKSKGKMCSKYLQNQTRAKVWKAPRYTNPKAGMTGEALPNRESKNAHTSLGKEEMLRHECLARNDDNQ